MINGYYTDVVYKDFLLNSESEELLVDMRKENCIILFASKEVMENIKNNEDMKFVFEYTAHILNRGKKNWFPVYKVQIKPEEEGVLRGIMGIGEGPMWVQFENNQVIEVFPGFPAMEEEFAFKVADELLYDKTKLV